MKVIKILIQINDALGKPNLVTCDENGNMVEEGFKKMERAMWRYWGNFARTGNPNDGTGAKYPEGSEYNNFI